MELRPTDAIQSEEECLPPLAKYSHSTTVRPRHSQTSIHKQVLTTDYPRHRNAQALKRSTTVNNITVLLA